MCSQTSYFDTTYYECCLKRYLVVHSSSYTKKQIHTYVTCKKVSTPPKFTVQTKNEVRNILYTFF